MNSLQWVACEVENLGVVVDAAGDESEVGRDALHSLLAAPPLTRALCGAAAAPTDAVMSAWAGQGLPPLVVITNGQIAT